MASRLLLVVNPSSSRAAEGAEQARAVLAEGGLALDEVRCPGESAGLAALVRERAPRLDGVVLGGGDGTLHAALPALLECGVPLGVLPLGTANDFAGAIGLPADPGEAAAVIVAGARRRVDVGLAGGRPFLNTASIGVAAELRRALTREGKRQLGALSYPLAALRRWRDTRAFTVWVRDEGAEVRVFRTRQLAVANGPRQGGGVVDPENAIDDGALALHAVEEGGLASLLLAHAALRLGRPAAARGLVALRGRAFEVAADRVLEVSADGERVGHTPMRFEIREGALEVFAPARAAASVEVLEQEPVVAWNRLGEALGASAAALADAAGRSDDAALADVLAALARRRRALAERVAVHVRGLGSLPKQEDADATALAALWSRARALVAGDVRAAVLAERAEAERALAACAREAAAADVPPSAARLAAGIAVECEHAAADLEAAGAVQPASSDSRSRASTE